MDTCLKMVRIDTFLGLDLHLDYEDLDYLYLDLDLDYLYLGVDSFVAKGS